MKTRSAALMICALAATAGTAAAQDAEGEKKPKLASSFERDVSRMKQRLSLSDSQAESLVKIFQDTEKAIRRLLTANQKEDFESRYNRQRSSDGNRGGFGGFGSRSGGMSRMMGGMAERMISGLTEELSLTEEQQQKAKKIMEEGQQAMQDAMAEARETGNWGGIRDAMRKGMEGGMAKLRKILTPEQQTKFDAYRENMSGRRGGRGRGDRGRRGGSSASARLRRIMADLQLTEDEKLVLEQQITAVLEAQDAARKAVQASRDKLREHMQSDARNSETIGARVQAVRTAEKRQRSQVGEARDSLRELVTVEQEAILVAHGVLE